MTHVPVLCSEDRFELASISNVSVPTCTMFICIAIMGSSRREGEGWVGGMEAESEWKATKNKLQQFKHVHICTV